MRSHLYTRRFFKRIKMRLLKALAFVQYLLNNKVIMNNYLFYFRENSIPIENDSENCDPTFCQSTSSSKTDQCSNIRTRSNKFFVLVNAHGAYTNGVLSFSGSNLLNVKSYQMS